MALNLTGKRRLTQIISAAGLNANFWGFGFERFCLPVMNCEACVLAWLGCPIGMMQASVAFMELPLMVLGTVLIIGVVSGRFLCGWACPMGLLQDLLHKIPVPAFPLPKFLTGFKYGFLIVGVLIIPFLFGDELPRPFCYICPTAAVQVVVPTMLATRDFALDSGLGVKVGILLSILLLAMGNRRVFCKVMCPLGALVAVTNRMAAFSIRVNPSDVTLKTTLGRASRGTHADRCSLFLYDRKRQEIWSKIAQDLEVEEIRLPVGAGFCGHVAQTGEIVNVPDAYADPRFDPDTDTKTGYRTRSVLTVPVLDTEGEIVAVLQALNKRDGVFTHQDETILTGFAGQIAKVIWEAKSCVRCRRCDKRCPMDVPVMASQDRDRAVNRSTECIGCLRCQESCPTGAIGNNSVILAA